MNDFLTRWHDAATTSLAFFWMALWAFALGYLISSLIQVLVTRQRMQRAMGEAGPRSVALGTFFGFISSSCSFSALAATRSIFAKGAGLVPALAFLLASTNLVIELGIVIAIFLSWQFVVGEYVGGVLLILFAWLFVRATRPTGLIDKARRKLESHAEHGDPGDWRHKLSSREGWQEIGATYVGEWQMVWKDVLIGFTVAGVIAAFLPDAFFAALFPGSDGATSAHPGFLATVAQALIGPVAAFFTFIGSMGNIPLAALLFHKGVSFAGVMAFIFSDLVVLPVLRINAQYYGWRMALYILVLLLCGLVVVSVGMHYGLLALDLLPSADASRSIATMERFGIDYTFGLNVAFLTMTGVLIWFWRRSLGGDGGGHHEHHDHGGASLTDRILAVLAGLAAIWLIVGVSFPLLGLV
jgi:uncharacterized membrane protein YraQ (UPF0718 family)